MHLVVNDIHAAREHLRANGIEATGVYHCDTGYACRYPGGDGRVDGRHPDGGTYGSFVSFEDPDGNGWVLQEVTARFPGRVEGETTYASAEDLSRALRRAAAAQGQDGASDPEWLDRLAGYMVREQAGRALPS
jgi:hypothetical protein